MKKNRTRQIALSLGTFLAIALLYLFGYFLPGMKSLNRIRREAADIRFEIGEFRKTLSVIRFSDRKEEEVMAIQERRLQTELERIETAGALESWQDGIEAHLVTLASRAGIGRLEISRTGPSDDWSGIRLRSFPIPGLAARSRTIAFSAPLKKAFVFLASIAAASVHLALDRLEIREGSPNPVFRIGVKAAFRGALERPADGNEADIDIDSALLLGPISEIPADEVDLPGGSEEWSSLLFIGKQPWLSIEKN